MIPSCPIRWVSPNLINSFSVQCVVTAPKTHRVTSALLGQRSNFTFEPDKYAASLPDVRARQAYLHQLKETNEGAYIRYTWPGGFAEYVLFVKPVMLPDGNLIYGMHTHDQQSVRPLLQLPMIGPRHSEIQAKRPPYALTLEKLRSLAPGQPTRYVEPLERAYDTRFPKRAEADWNVLTNLEALTIAAVRPYATQWRNTIYQYGTNALIDHPPAHWATVLRILEGKTVLSLRSKVSVDEVIEQESRTPQTDEETHLHTSCYLGPCSFMLVEDEGFIFCFDDDDQPLTVPVPNHHLSLADWIGAGAAVLTPTQVEAREVLRRRQLNKTEQVNLPVVETLASLPHNGSPETMSERFARVIAEHCNAPVAEETST